MTKPVWSHDSALNAWTLKKLIKSVARKPEPKFTNIFMQGKFLTN